MADTPLRIGPLDWRTPIVNPNGTPNNYFIRLWQVSFVNQDTDKARIKALEDAELQAGTGISITPNGHLLSNPTISANIQALLNVISTTQGAVLYRGASSWLALNPGTSGYVLKTQGPAANPQWAPDSAGTGTVTSVDGASSASGFTLTGGPITTAGTLTFNISNAANARASLGLVIGTDVQAFSSKLAAYAGGDTPSAFTLGIVDSVDAAAWRAAIGAGTSTVTPAALTKVDDTNVTLALGGAPATALLQATSLTLGWTGTLSVPRGGSGAATLTGYLKGNGAAAFTAVASIPASDISGGAALTKTDDTNVTLTLGGAPTSALLAATSLTLGWTGTLSVARGGTGSGTAGGAPWVQKSGDTMSGDLTFSGSGRRIFADFSDSLASNRFAFQSSVTNNITAVGIIPNGTSTQAQLMVFNNSDPNNASLMNFVAQATEVSFRSGTTGTGTTVPVSFYVGGVSRVTISTSGDLQMGGANTVIDVNRAHLLRQYTVATLPTPGTVGRLVAVSDALAPAFLVAIAGGGAIRTPVYDNGTNWVAT